MTTLLYNYTYRANTFKSYKNLKITKVLNKAAKIKKISCKKNFFKISELLYILSTDI